MYGFDLKSELDQTRVRKNAGHSHSVRHRTYDPIIVGTWLRPEKAQKPKPNIVRLLLVMSFVVGVNICGLLFSHWALVLFLMEFPFQQETYAPYAAAAICRSTIFLCEKLPGNVANRPIACIPLNGSKCMVGMQISAGISAGSSRLCQRMHTEMKLWSCITIAN